MEKSENLNGDGTWRSEAIATHEREKLRVINSEKGKHGNGEWKNESYSINED